MRVPVNLFIRNSFQSEYLSLIAAGRNGTNDNFSIYTLFLCLFIHLNDPAVTSVLSYDHTQYETENNIIKYSV